MKNAKIGTDGERDRVLGEAVLIDLLKKLPCSGMVETAQRTLLIQMATITRIGETVIARWEHVYFGHRLWVLPETKNGQLRQVWLSKFALRQFERLHAITGETPWCFPGSRYEPAIEKTNLPLDAKTVTKQVADRQRKPGDKQRSIDLSIQEGRRVVIDLVAKPFLSPLILFEERSEKS